MGRHCAERRQSPGQPVQDFAGSRGGPNLLPHSAAGLGRVAAVVPIGPLKPLDTIVL